MKSKIVYEDVGNRIYEARCKRGYSRVKVAEKTGISEKFLYEIEKGKKGFSSDILYRIANVIDVSCDYILRGERGITDTDRELMAIIERFDEGKVRKLIRMMKMLRDF